MNVERATKAKPKGKGLDSADHQYKKSSSIRAKEKLTMRAALIL